jgi:predicted AlkP superfamily phosphohydrolase/phosphomutase
MSNLLVAMGYATPTGLSSHHGGRYFHDRVVRTAMRRASAMTPAAVRNLLRPVTRPIRRAIGSVAYPSREDYRRSRCFAIHDNPAHSGIRINLAGREPGGLVQPGAEADHLCDELTSALMSLRNLDTDEKLVSRIIPVDEACSGPYRDHLPDLLVEWNQANPVTRIGSPLMGDMACQLNHPRTGHHRAGGFFLASGPGIEPGVLEETYSVMDYAPTLADLLDVPADDLDGIAIAPLVNSRIST